MFHSSASKDVTLISIKECLSWLRWRDDREEENRERGKEEGKRGEKERGGESEHLGRYCTGSLQMFSPLVHEGIFIPPCHACPAAGWIVFWNDDEQWGVCPQLPHRLGTAPSGISAHSVPFRMPLWYKGLPTQVKTWLLGARGATCFLTVQTQDCIILCVGSA